LGEKGLGTVVDKFGYGAQDEDWIPKAAAWGFVYVTLDKRQLHDTRIAPILKQAGARAIFLPNRFAHLNRWDQALWLLKHWKPIAVRATDLQEGQLIRVTWTGRIVEI